MASVAVVGSLASASELYERVERQLWSEARHLWRGWKGSSVEEPYGTQVVNHADAADAIWRAALTLDPSLDDRFTRSDTVTLAKNKRPIERHRDNPVHAGTHKLLIFANAADDCDVGGTRFFLESGGALDIEYAAGRVVLFDLTLEHEGLRNNSGRLKRTLGLRLFARA